MLKQEQKKKKKKFGGTLFGLQEFTEKEHSGIQKQLSQPIAKEHLSKRPGGGGTFDYVCAWIVIDLANRVFGFNGWSSQIVSVKQDHFGQTREGKFEVAVSALVRVTLKDGSFREGFGFGASSGMKNKFLCLESGKKKAITDATKRALKLFGNYLGNGLSIKEDEFTRYEKKRKSRSVYEAAEVEIKYELKKPRNNSQMPNSLLSSNPKIKKDPMGVNTSPQKHNKQQQQQSIQHPNVLQSNVQQSNVQQQQSFKQNSPLPQQQQQQQQTLINFQSTTTMNSSQNIGNSLNFNNQMNKQLTNRAPFQSNQLTQTQRNGLSNNGVNFL
ncbi:DNA repair and recombination protein rad52 rad59 [Anaeramoeba flamelloides]|uniref:DNA repair and recombination protein rad52 rad59 n=1 Tax=Anaeramoeba flamelloides TaxID=1746091 RepID=A0AAV8AD01_9EUKA|nr:DNA repair and recombination protein rad52 rad59 [Anaeramoeba flamelloides]